MENNTIDTKKMQREISKGFKVDDEPTPEINVLSSQETSQGIELPKVDLPREEVPVTPERTKRKIVPKGDYETLFIFKNDLKERKTIYVAKDVQEKLAEIVMSMKRQEITIGIYVENIILHHFEMYKDEINILNEKKFKKLL